MSSLTDERLKRDDDRDEVFFFFTFIPSPDSITYDSMLMLMDGDDDFNSHPARASFWLHPANGSGSGLSFTPVLSRADDEAAAVDDGYRFALMKSSFSSLSSQPLSFKQSFYV